MEWEHKEYGGKGATAAGLTTGIIGTALGVLNGGGGIIGNLLGLNRNNSGVDAMSAILPLLMGIVGNRGISASETYVTRHELDMQNQITNRDMEIAFLKGRDAAKSDTLELYRHFDGKLGAQEAQINAIATSVAVSNTQTAGAIACLQQSVTALQALTSTKIPITSVCPTPAVATTTA